MKFSNIALAVLLTIIVYPCRGQTTNAITGAWGFKLGQIVDVKDTKHFATVSDHTCIYRPQKPYRKFDTYAISVTADHQVALISASHKFTNQMEFDAEKKALAGISIQKFGTPFNDDSAEAKDLSKLVFRKGGRQVTLKAKYPEISLYLQDDALSLTLAKEKLLGQ